MRAGQPLAALDPTDYTLAATQASHAAATKAHKVALAAQNRAQQAVDAVHAIQNRLGNGTVPRATADDYRRAATDALTTVSGAKTAAADAAKQGGVEKAITQLGVGEALVSTLEGKGAPSMVERTLIAPPMAQVGPIELTERQQIVASSPMKGKYDQPIDPESAYEMLAKRKQMAEAPALKIVDMRAVGDDWRIIAVPDRAS